jgi:hypothetical protein
MKRAESVIRSVPQATASSISVREVVEIGDRGTHYAAVLTLQDGQQAIVDATTLDELHRLVAVAREVFARSAALRRA